MFYAYNFLFILLLFFIMVFGLMYAVSTEGRNPTPRQIKNRIILKRKWRKFKKALAVDDVLSPFLGGLILIFALVLITFKMEGLI